MRKINPQEISASSANIDIPTNWWYVEQEDMRGVISITDFNAEIERIVTRGDVLRREIDAIIAEI